ncbi:hypothetical protein [Coleofasciculus sp. F4-SAH-05]
MLQQISKYGDPMAALAQFCQLEAEYQRVTSILQTPRRQYQHS